jgi:lysophospholipase L1-like esterase
VHRILRAANLVVVNLALLIGLLLLLELLAWMAIEAKNAVAPGDNAERPPKYRQQAHEGHQDWIWQYLEDDRAHSFRYRVGLWEPPDFASETLNVSGGFRASGAEGVPASAGDAFVLGGSTVWGIGVKDEYTLPALLNAADAGRYRFVNCGRPAFQSTQEVLELTLLLAGGRAPDLVVLYDGANDITTAVQDGPGREMGHAKRAALLAESPGGIAASLFAKTNLSKLLSAVSVRLRAWAARREGNVALTPEDRGLAAEALAIYLGNVRYVKRLGREFGFETVAFLQPYLLSGFEVEAGAVTDFERDLYEGQPRRLRALVRLFYEEAARSGEVVDLSRTLAERGVPGSYFDVVHLGPAGNEAMARAIAEHLP